MIVLLFDFLGQLPEFCSRDSSLVVKEIFGVTEYASILYEIKTLKSLLVMLITFLFALSEDADKLRIHTLSEAGDMDSLEKMVEGSDSEDSSEG